MKNSLIIALILYLIVTGITNRLDKLELISRIDNLTIILNEVNQTSTKAYSISISNSVYLRQTNSLIQESLGI